MIHREIQGVPRGVKITQTSENLMIDILHKIEVVFGEE